MAELPAPGTAGRADTPRTAARKLRERYEREQEQGRRRRERERREREAAERRRRAAEEGVRRERVRRQLRDRDRAKLARASKGRRCLASSREGCLAYARTLAAMLLALAVCLDVAQLAVSSMPAVPLSQGSSALGNSSIALDLSMRRFSLTIRGGQLDGLVIADERYDKCPLEACVRCDEGGIATMAFVITALVLKLLSLLSLMYHRYMGCGTGQCRSFSTSTAAASCAAVICGVLSWLAMCHNEAGASVRSRTDIGAAEDFKISFGIAYYIAAIGASVTFVAWLTVFCAPDGAERAFEERVDAELAREDATIEHEKRVLVLVAEADASADDGLADAL